jgi:hypothetical protein
MQLLHKTTIKQKTPQAASTTFLKGALAPKDSVFAYENGTKKSVQMYFYSYKV